MSLTLLDYLKVKAIAETVLPTFSAGRSPVGRLGAVADEAAALLDAAAAVVAQAAGAAAVTGATGADAGRHPGALLQVEVDAVDGQRSDAAQEAPLPGGRPPCSRTGATPLVICGGRPAGVAPRL